jgi:hypothetical protein
MLTTLLSTVLLGVSVLTFSRILTRKSKCYEFCGTRGPRLLLPHVLGIGSD